MAEADDFDRCRLGVNAVVDQVRPLEHVFATGIIHRRGAEVAEKNWSSMT
jgi:hypothetical protein